MARRTLTVLKVMAAWALSRDLITTNIFAAIRLPGKASSRERVLDHGEIAALLTVLGDMPYPAGPLVRLLPMLGVRRTEISEARWREFDLDAREWRLGGARAKNGKELLLPLPDGAATPRKRAARARATATSSGEPSIPFGSKMRQSAGPASGIRTPPPRMPRPITGDRVWDYVRVIYGTQSRLSPSSSVMVPLRSSETRSPIHIFSGNS